MFPLKSKWNPIRATAWLILSLAGSFAAIAQQPATRSTEAASTITALPQIDREIHDAIQSRSYGEAVKLIEAAIAAGSAKSADYLRYLQGIALTEDERFDDAIATFEQLEQEHPESPWVSRSRFGRANVYVLRRQYIEAGQIYQREAERLLSRDRKDTLAQIYLEYADRYFEGIPASDPSRAKQPDYQQALTYYTEAAKLGTTPRLSQRIAFRIDRATRGSTIPARRCAAESWPPIASTPHLAGFLGPVARSRRDQRNGREFSTGTAGRRNDSVSIWSRQ